MKKLLFITLFFCLAVSAMAQKILQIELTKEQMTVVEKAIKKVPSNTAQLKSLSDAYQRREKKDFLDIIIVTHEEVQALYDGLEKLYALKATSKKTKVVIDQIKDKIKIQLALLKPKN